MMMILSFLALTWKKMSRLILKTTLNFYVINRKENHMILVYSRLNNKLVNALIKICQKFKLKLNLKELNPFIENIKRNPIISQLK